VNFLGTFIVIMVVLLAIKFGYKRDDTDSKDDRSGLVLYTDYGTGCQYVGTMFGGITPRLDADGKIVCVKK
jgi:hypothetical protein